MFILATQNRHKVGEILKILRSRFGDKHKRKIKLLCLLDFENPPKIIENGRTFEENALKKARTIAKKYQHPAMADDSGLVVNCLGGAPGIKSARYAGSNPTSAKLCQKLIREIEKVGGFPKSQIANTPRVTKKNPLARNLVAKFVCCVAVVWPASKEWPDGHEKIVRGEVSGHIINEMRGHYGFGYDPVFIPLGFTQTFAQMSSVLKNRISHRARALRKLARIISR